MSGQETISWQCQLHGMCGNPCSQCQSMDVHLQILLIKQMGLEGPMLKRIVTQQPAWELGRDALQKETKGADTFEIWCVKCGDFRRQSGSKYCQVCLEGK